MLFAFALAACTTETPDSSDNGDSGGDTAPTITAPPLVINEVLAKNDTYNTDNAGENDDWVELYNPSDTILQLDGFYLSDTESEPTLYQFPAGKGVQGHGYLVVWCDKAQAEQETTEELHATFKLGAKGDFVFLSYAEDNQVVTADSVRWDSTQTADIAAARVPDGSKNWVNQAPTYDESNGG